MNKGDEYKNWPLAKKYQAAHFYLKNENLTTFQEVQKAQLSAVHLQLTYGNFGETLIVHETLFGSTDRQKRDEEWKKCSNLSRQTLMRRFVEFLDEMVPKWTMSRRLYDDFELEYKKQSFRSGKNNSNKINIGLTEETSKTKRSRRLKLMGLKQTSPQKSETFNFDIGKRPIVFKHLEKDEIRNKKRVILKVGSGPVLPFLPRNNLLASPTKSDNQTPRLLHSFGSQQQLTRSHLDFKSPLSTNRTNLKDSDPSFTDDYDDTIASLMYKLEKMQQNHAANFWNDLDEFTEMSFKELNTDLWINIFKPKFDMLGIILNELEDLFKSKYDNWSNLMQKVREGYSTDIGLMFQYIETLDKSASTQTSSQSNQTDFKVNLLYALDNLNEIYEPANHNAKLYGVTKLERQQYKANFEKSKRFFRKHPSEEFDFLEKLEKIFSQNERTISDLNTVINENSKQQEKFDEAIKKIQENAFKDNIDLSNSVKYWRSSVGLVHGENYETKLNQLETENEELRDALAKQLKKLMTSPSLR